MALTSAAALGAACAALLATGTRSAASFLDPGGLGPSAAIICRDFGPAAVPAGQTGYDGQRFYAVARFFPDLTRAAHYLDAPHYRLLRIGAPALASVAGRGTALVVALLALNVLGVGLAVGALADLARRHGRPAWIGYAAVPGLGGGSPPVTWFPRSSSSPGRRRSDGSSADRRSANAASPSSASSARRDRASPSASAR
jgi:hypothetical protein